MSVELWYPAYVMVHGPLSTQEIATGLHCRRIGTHIEGVGSVTSTNDVAWQRVDQGADDGLVIFAEHQVAGRGRFGRKWESPHGASVLCSVVVVDDADVLKGGSLGLICAIAACDAIRSAALVAAEIRWPNDLVVNQRKIGGVLVECRPRRAPGRVFVAGIGINCLQHGAHFAPDLQDKATSLDLEGPHPVDRTRVCRTLLRQLDGWLARPKRCNPEEIRQAWLDRAVGLGGRVRLQHEGRVYAGVVLDLDPTAALVIQLDEGGRMLFDADTTTLLER